MQSGEAIPIIPAVVRLRDEGRKIDAVHLYRKTHPEADLREALDDVNLM